MDSIWLESISRAAMYSYCEEILRIPDISEHATKQLLTDIGKSYIPSYLQSVRSLHIVFLLKYSSISQFNECN